MVEFAQDFGKKFKEIGVAEFFRKNLHMLGYSGPIRSFTTIIHEFVTNSLDACEEYGILPHIVIRVKRLGEKHYIVSCEDNGPGIPPEYVPKVFGSMLAGTKFHRYIQSRGQQGIGAVGAILFSQMTTGKPVKIISSTGRKASVVFLKVDIHANRAKILEQHETDAEWHGTKIVAEFKDIDYRKGEQSPFEYLRRTAIANPHARIVFYEPDGKKTVWERSTAQVPPKPKEMKPHPLGLTADDLLALAKTAKTSKVRTFLVNALSRVSAKKAMEVLRIARVNPGKNPRELSYREVSRIVEAFKSVKLLSPPTEGLIPIGEEHLEKSLREVLKPDFVRAITRKPSTYRGGIPFQVEVAIAYGGGAGRRTEDGAKPEIMRFANRAPLLFDTGACAITQAVRSINWRNYNLGDFESAPLTIVVNVISPYVPYMSAGKQAIAEDPDIVREIRLGLMEAARGLKRHIAGIYRAQLRKKKRSIFMKYIPVVSEALSKLTGKPEPMIRNKLVGIVEKKIEIPEETREKTEETEIKSTAG